MYYNLNMYTLKMQMQRPGELSHSFIRIENLNFSKETLNTSFDVIDAGIQLELMDYPQHYGHVHSPPAKLVVIHIFYGFSTFI